MKLFKSRNRTEFEIGKFYKTSEQGRAITGVLKGVLYYQAKIVREGIIYHLYTPIDNSTLRYLFQEIPNLENLDSERIFKLHKIIDRSEL